MVNNQLVQNFHTELSNGKCTFHLVLATISRPFGFYPYLSKSLWKWNMHIPWTDFHSGLWRDPFTACNGQEVKPVCCGFQWRFLLYTLTSLSVLFCLAVGVLFSPLSACWFLCRKGLKFSSFSLWNDRLWNDLLAVNFCHAWPSYFN